jgi:hypothetical protein
MRTIGNIFWLGTKELRSFMRDFTLLGLVIYAFTIAIISQAQSYSQEVHNASSPLSTRIIRYYRGGLLTRSCRPISSRRSRLPKKTSSL